MSEAAQMEAAEAAHRGIGGPAADSLAYISRISDARISYYNKTELKSYVCSRIDKKHECFSRTSGTSLSLKIIHQLGGGAKNEGKAKIEKLEWVQK